MHLSYWEYKTWLSDIDYTIVGSGIVGLNCALQLKNRFPKAKILILEKGILPQGASTKNAGFACFGSISEILSDLRQHSKEEVCSLVEKRWEGLQLLRKNLGDKAIAFQLHGGHELFLETHHELFAQCSERIKEVNEFLYSIFKEDVFKLHSNSFHFKKIKQKYITNSFEAQLDTGKMMDALLQLVQRKGIRILNSVTVSEFSEHTAAVSVKTDQLEFETTKLLIATNGFAAHLIDGVKVNPARAQVLITKPIANLHIKGTFHLDEGYYYFRNIDGRILLGGGRNLDFKGETTDSFGETAQIQTRLEKLLTEVILPDTHFEIERRWSGIMGVGQEKKPIVQQLSDSVYCGVRLGGMGVAIGSLVGKELADLL
ncbi:NAD(P)/FAD-dependent oxidoreductase [Kriegella aquimaris]|uniref:Glycine/D-amino acid oxidase n=1 Tax=Kriegella aquimaris TaxID=192904 RepID=A0A1G9LGY4_9FLAO|nr:FAD-dependent oxidoreductase [Kriegella aquimaris]SDL61210.1 Glycine/D-amino acid oxidase [Kriegella aquimaris]